MPPAATDEEAGVPDEAVVSLLDAVSHALDGNKPVGEQLQLRQQIPGVGPLPPSLPPGWVMKESRSQPNYFYYYNIETGESTWYSPEIVPEDEENQVPGVDAVDTEAPNNLSAEKIADKLLDHNRKRAAAALSNATPSNISATKAEGGPIKKAKKSSRPSKVRILHILKKHKGSRRPSSWRTPKITSTKEEATEELKGLIEILKEESGEDQRATFEELARTESDCSVCIKNTVLELYEMECYCFSFVHHWIPSHLLYLFVFVCVSTSWTYPSLILPCLFTLT